MVGFLVIIQPYEVVSSISNNNGQSKQDTINLVRC